MKRNSTDFGGQGENGPGTPRTPPREALHRSPQTFQQLNRNNNVSVKETYGLYQETVVNLLCQSFLSLYREVEEPLWNNSTFAYVRRSYHLYDQDLGIFEIHIPTALNGENFMQYCSVRVKVVPEMDQEKFKDLAQEVTESFTSPMGFQDSGCLFIVAQKANKPWPRGPIVMGGKGYALKMMVYAIADKFPERAVKRILTLVGKHFKSRLDAFVKKLGLPRWMVDRMLYEIRKGKNFSLIYNLSQRFSMTIMTILENFLGIVNYLARKLRWIYRIIGEQNILKQSIWKLKDLKQDLEVIPELHQAVNNLLLAVKRKLRKSRDINRSIDNSFIEKSKCSSIDNTIKEHHHNLNYYPYQRFRDHPKDLLKREKRVLSYLEGNGQKAHDL